MDNRLIGMLVAGIVAAGCQKETFPEQGMDKAQWMKVNSAAELVYHDENMEVWNMDQHCYYFMKGHLEHAFRCGNLSATD